MSYQFPEEKKNEFVVYLIVCEIHRTLYLQSPSKESLRVILIHNSPCFLSCDPVNLVRMDCIRSQYLGQREVVMVQF